MDIFRKTALMFLAAVVAAPVVAVDQFWLTDARSGDVTGPIVFTPGTKFQIGGATFIMLSADNDGIEFVEVATTRHHGPYGFVENRIIRLADKPFYFSKIETFTGTNPESVKTETVRGDADFKPGISDFRKSNGLDADDGEDARPAHGWDRPALPSTNPADHKEIPQFTIVERKRPPAIAAWIEPLSNTRYDWKVGGFAGNSDQKLQSTVFGVSGVFGRWQAEAGIVSGSELSGTIVPDNSYLTGLKLKGGGGLMLGGTYAYAFEIDERWNASFAARLLYRSVKYDMTGTYLTRHNEILTAEEAEAYQGSKMTYDDRGERVGMNELTASIIAGLDYESDSWGTILYIALDVYTHAQFTGSLILLDEEYSLTADKRHPVEAGAAAWVEVDDRLRVFTGVTVGAKQSVRFGMTKSF